MTVDRPAGPDWRLERMTRADLPAVVEIERASFPDPWPESVFLQEIRSGNHSRCLLVRRSSEGPETRPAGYVCFWILAEELLINNLAVDPAMRRQGAGRFLLDGALRQGREGGCRVAFLEVRPSNEPAIRLYQASGFTLVGRRKGYYQSTGEDALLMRASLESLQNRVL